MKGPRSVLCLVIALAIAGSSFSAGPASGFEQRHGPNFWAGQWTTSTGGVAFRVLDENDIKIARTEQRHALLYDRLPCKDGPQFYRGGYTGSNRGKVIACGTSASLNGRWSSNDISTDNGSFTIAITSRHPLKFSGTATPDGGRPFKWTGSWDRHFGGDGCCDLATAEAVKRLVVIFAFDGRASFLPNLAKVTGDALITICNEAAVATKVFSISPSARYTTLAKVQGKAGRSFQWRLPGKGKTSLRPGQCDSFNVRNPTGASLTLNLFDEIHAATKLSVRIEPARK